TLGSTPVVNNQQYYDWTDFDAVKNITIPSGQTVSFANSGRSSVFHFALAAHNQGGSTSSGISRGIPTSDFMVTLGSFYGHYGTTSNSFVAVSNVALSIDWNCNGTIDTSSVAYDTNNDGPQTTLAPAGDWSNFTYTGGLVGHGDKQPLPSQTLSDELTPEQE